MEITLKVFRYNPEVDKQFHYETYTFEGEETDRILDLLENVKGYMDGTLSFRRSCAHGVCGSDAMRINGKNMLACKSLVRDVGTTITVEPILGLKVIKDLIVDMDPFFDNYKKMLPWFINNRRCPRMGGSACRAPSSAPASTTRPSASCARPAPPPARRSGPVRNTTAPPRWWPPTASSTTAATKAPPSAWRSSPRPAAWRAAIPSTTAPTPARAISRSPRRLGN